MINAHPTSIKSLTNVQSNVLAAVCLLVGIAAGWLLHSPQNTQQTASTQPASLSSAVPGTNGAAAPASSPARLKEMADAQAAPLLEQLKTGPKDATTLISLGNLYYDAQQYPAAVNYYGQALQSRPSDTSVRTDMGTAYWYMGDADTAISEFDKALTYEPNQPNTLFNRGLVRFKRKMDSAGAIADWQRLLAANPNYDQRAKVEQMIAEAKAGGGSSAAARP
jgi:cytochrome c-type biogenesis protein CcmH/NrfG